MSGPENASQASASVALLYGTTLLQNVVGDARRRLVMVGLAGQAASRLEPLV